MAKAPPPPTAEKPTAPSGDVAKAPSQSPSTETPSSASSHPSSNEVAQMQQQILDIYTQFKQSNFFRKDPARNLAEEKAEDPEGSAFRSFFFDHFVMPSNIKGTYGQQPYPGDSPAAKTKPAMMAFEHGDDVIRMLETLSHVGAHTKEGFNKPDGVWGEFTNNALKNTYALLKGMQQFSGKMGMGVQFPKNLDDLQKFISPSAKSVPNPSSNAKEISKILSDVKASIPVFLNKVDADPHISGKAPVITLKQKPQALNSTDERAFGDQAPLFPLEIAPNTLPNIEHAKPLQVNLYDLANKDTFESFIKRNGILVDADNPLTNKSLIPKLIAAIEQKINAISTKSQPAAQPSDTR